MRKMGTTMAAALLWAAPAWAENTSTLQTAKLDANFSLCTEGAPSCTGEVWHIAINAKGWTLQGTTEFDGETQNWNETCEDGRYGARIAEDVLTGTCRVHGDPDALCFEAEMVLQADNLTGTSRQCFQLLAPHICTFTFEAELGSGAERTKTALGTVNSCVVSEAR